MKYLIILLFFLKIEAAYAIPLCAPQKFEFSMNDVISSLVINSSDDDDKYIFAVDLKAKSNSNYTGKLLFFDNGCNLKYIEKLDYYPISIFALDDGASGVTFNLTQSGDGTYILYAYYLNDSNIIKIIDGAASNPTRPMFLNDPNVSAPMIKVYNRFSKTCETYRFNKKYIKYINSRSNKICKYYDN
jgi:hypothetical protein